MPSTRVPAPKARLKSSIDRARNLSVGDELDIRVKVTGRRKLTPSSSVVSRDVVTIQIPGYKTPVTVDIDKLIG